MAAAIALIVVGFTLAYSALKGLSLTDVLSGATGDRLDPKGGTAASRGKVTGPAAADAAAGADPKGQFKGPNAKLLRTLADAATGQFNLTITDVCRSKARACANGACNSLHTECRAFDASGSPSDMIAYTKWADATYGGTIDELFHTPAGARYAWPDHTDHVHTGA